MEKSDPEPEKKQANEENEGNKTDSSYILSEPEDQEYVPPTKNEITEALFNKYNVDEGEIAEEPE